MSVRMPTTSEVTSKSCGARYSWPPPTRPEDGNLTVDRNLTAALFPETRERQSGRVVRAD